MAGEHAWNGLLDGVHCRSDPTRSGAEGDPIAAAESVRPSAPRRWRRRHSAASAQAIAVASPPSPAATAIQRPVLRDVGVPATGAGEGGATGAGEGSRARAAFWATTGTATQAPAYL